MSLLSVSSSRSGGKSAASICCSARVCASCKSCTQGLSMPSPACLVDLAKLFSVSTDYLLCVERLEVVNVTGLDEKDVAILVQLADRLREAR